MKVPFLDLKAQYASIQNEIASALQQVLNNAAFAGGPFVDPSNDDFYLRATSPCIDAGTAVSLNQDFRGTPIRGREVDIGALGHISFVPPKNLPVLRSP